MLDPPPQAAYRIDMRKRGSAAAAGLLALALTVPAWGQTDAPAKDTPAPAATGAPEVKRLSTFRRPVFLGLIAAAFLIVGAACGGNDRPDGDPKPTA